MKNSKKLLFSEVFRKQDYEVHFFSKQFWPKCSLGSCATLSEDMVVISILGFASQV